MKKLPLLSLIAISIILTGCASPRDPMRFTGNAYGKTKNQIRNSIIEAATKNNWFICDTEDGRLRADTLFKRGKIFTDIIYAKDGFLIKPNAKYTTYAKEDGSVHRSVNNITKRLYKFVSIRLTYPIQEEPYKIPTCINYDSMHSDDYGITFGSKAYVSIGFAWVKKDNVTREKPVITFEIVDDKISLFNDSLNRRLMEYIDARGMSFGSGPKYKIEIHPIDSVTRSQSGGEVYDFLNLVEGFKQYQIRAIVLNENKEQVCILDVGTRVYTSGITGAINKATTKETAALAEGLLSVLESKLTDRE